MVIGTSPTSIFQLFPRSYMRIYIHVCIPKRRYRYYLPTTTIPVLHRNVPRTDAFSFRPEPNPTSSDEWYQFVLEYVCIYYICIDSQRDRCRCRRTAVSDFVLCYVHVTIFSTIRWRTVLAYTIVVL